MAEQTDKAVGMETHVLTERELRQVETWARQTRLPEMLSFFEGLPRRFTVPRPLLLGSNGPEEILVDGLASRWRVISTIAHLDEPFNPHLRLQRFLMAKWRAQKIGTLQPIFRELRKGFAKLCLAEDLGGCRGKIVRAHTLQKAAFQAHARSGHVYEFDPFEAAPELRFPTPIGINEATTFTGFCEHHDAELFKSIETAPFEGTPQQFFLHHYRSVALGFYNRVYKAKILETAYQENSAKPDIGSLRSLETTLRNNRLDAAELERHKRFYDQQLLEKNWASVEGHAWVGAKVPDLFAADFVAPRKDLQGRLVQETRTTQPLHWLSLTLTTTGDRALFLLCAEKGSPLLAALVDSLKRLPRDRRTMAVVNFIVCQLENFIILPNWWDSLGEATQRRIANAFNSRYFPRDLPKVCEWKLSEFRRGAPGTGL